MKSPIYYNSIKNQNPKSGNEICGYIIEIVDFDKFSLVLLADGLGKGIKANIYAKFISSRIVNMIRNGFSFYDAVLHTTKTIHENMGKDFPYAAFNIGRLSRNGKIHFYNFHAPSPVIISGGACNYMMQGSVVNKDSHFTESSAFLKAGDRIIIFSDGIVEAGTGIEFDFGWGMDNLVSFIKKFVDSKGDNPHDLNKAIIDKVRDINKGFFNDDTSILTLELREARVLNILTGPPSSKELDHKYVNDFKNEQGVHIICGDTTSKIVARELDLELKLDNESLDSLITPPEYKMKGFRLVTEGAVTLNQVYNILDEDPDKVDKINSVTTLFMLLHAVDRINIFMGEKKNKSHNDLVFRQKGIIDREKIINLIEAKMLDYNKNVVIKRY